MRKVLLRALYPFVLCFFLLTTSMAFTGGRFHQPVNQPEALSRTATHQAPTITAPANVEVNTDLYSNFASAVSLGTPVTTGSDVSVTNNAPSTYPVGITTVTWTVVDNTGNTATATQTVTVTDKEKPYIERLGEISVVNDPGKCGAFVNLFTPYTSDNSGVVNLTNDAPSFFPVGSLTIIWTATDMYGNSDTSTQMITVIDNELPTISIGNIMVTNEPGKCGAVVKLGTPLTADNCGIAYVTNNAPAFFPVGTTIVTWTVTDLNAYTATVKQSVTITDIQKPTITAPADKTVTVRSNAGSATNVNLGTPITADNCGVKAVTNNAPLSYPIGTTMVTWTVSDYSGNISTATQTVKVTRKRSDAVVETAVQSSIVKEIIENGDELSLTVAPNPSTTYFTLRLLSKYDMPVHLLVRDGTGRLIEARTRLTANSTIQIGHNYYSGTYFAEMIQGKQHKIVQLIKIK